LQKQGKIRYWGLSLNTFEPLPEAEYLMKKNSGNGFQLVLNLLNQRALPLLKQAAAKGYGIIARMPLQFGLLTGKFTPAAKGKNDKPLFADNDHRKNRLTNEIIYAGTESLEPVWQLCRKYNCSKIQLALSYILSYREVSVIIPGIRTADHVTGNTLGLFQLDNADRKLIEEMGEKEFTRVMELIQKQG
jgi:aryl-alcohol dehydrogenase-like predicted oxidoreductase